MSDSRFPAKHDVASDPALLAARADSMLSPGTVRRSLSSPLSPGKPSPLAWVSTYWYAGRVLVDFQLPLRGSVFLCVFGVLCVVSKQIRALVNSELEACLLLHEGEQFWQQRLERSWANVRNWVEMGESRAIGANCCTLA